MNISFSKYHGTGNDFILIDDRNMQFSVRDSKLINRLCNRHFGIGADGLILLRGSEEDGFHMIYYNSDGNESSMCGNGGRCLAAFAKKLDLIENKFTFSAIDGIHEVNIESMSSIELKMNKISSIERDDEAWVLDTGSPHYVKIVEDIQSLNLIEGAREIRYSKKYNETGINVNFFQIKNGKISMRTYERGVENETLSCGTGTVAVACVAVLSKHVLSDGGYIPIYTNGGNLFVKLGSVTETSIDNIWLKGPAEFVFEGSFTI